MARNAAASIYFKLWDKYHAKDCNTDETEEEMLNDGIEVARFVKTDELGNTKNTLYDIIYTGNDVVLSEQVRCGARTDIKAIARVSRLGYIEFCDKVNVLYRKRAAIRKR